MLPISYKGYTIGTFNVRGFVKREKQELLAGDVNSQDIDACCLQETQFKEGLIINIAVR